MPDVSPIPEDYPRVSPYLAVAGAAAALDFYVEVLGATRRGDAMVGPDGKIGHAEIQIGDSVIMIADEYPEIGFLAPPSVGGTPVTLLVYVEDVDAVFDKAIEAGATVVDPLKDHFYGDRSGQFDDPFGHRWNVASHVEDVAPDEMARRAEEAARGAAE